MRRALAALFAVLWCLPSFAVAEGDAPSPARQQELVHLVRQDCGACHGLTLRGGLGPALLPQRLASWTEEDLAATILEGRPGKPMPPFRDILSRAEARWIARRLQQGFPVDGTR